MNQKNIEHIELYYLVLVSTLVAGVLVRHFVLSRDVKISVVLLHFFNSHYLNDNLCQFTDNFQPATVTTHRNLSISFHSFSNDEKLQ